MNKLILVLLILCINNSFAVETYIIMADPWYQRNNFRDRADVIEEIADEIAEDYKGIILHLGNEVIFDKGGDYYYTSSKNNLKKLSDILISNNRKIYFWFFDSFGSEAFSYFYRDYNIKIDKIKRDLDKQDLLYDGIVIDLEWINYSQMQNIDNSAKYLEILTYLRSVFVDKEIMVFASLVDNEAENRRRGYDLKAIKRLNIKPLSMLYIKDGGFRTINAYPSPIISDERIRQLREYYVDNNIGVSVAVEKGIIVKRNYRYYFIRNFRNQDQDIEKIYSNLTYIKSIEGENYKIEVFKSKSNFEFQKNDKTYEEIKKGEELYIFSVKADIVEKEDFIWEYYKMYEK